jgi:16S rRNA (guanine(966)-N(2))-methyltransferase RsmD
MRIIAGAAKGTRLVPPPDHSVRPTLDRVREACFSILGSAVENARFLDLFAGTGANGLEAISRGAASAVLVDSDRNARAVIQRNIERTHASDRVEVSTLSLPSGLQKLANRGPFDIVYADPPHSYDAIDMLVWQIADAALVAPGGVLIVEHDKRITLPESVAPLERVRDATYGETTLSFYRASENA